jgi:hypothetical protein
VAVISRPWLKPHAKRRLQLLFCLWLGRIALIWFLTYPIYQPLAGSGLLRSSRTDRDLLGAGGEVLLALLGTGASSLAAAASALCVLAVVAGVIALLGSSFAWVATNEHRALFGLQIRNRVCAVVPTFAATTIATIGCSAMLAGCWWQLFPLIGETLEPVLGERGTDYVQLFVLTCLFAAIAVLCTLSDLVRAVVAAYRLPFRAALQRAARLYRLQPLRITANAVVRFGPVLSIQLANAWQVAHNQWLAGSDWLLAIAVAVSESVALLAIWLRLDWIEWLSKTQRTSC